MGFLFKTKEEKEEIKKQRMQKAQEDREAIRNSSVTHAIAEFLVDEFSGDGGGEILNDFRSCKFAVLNVFRSGVGIRIFHKRKKPDGSDTTPYGIINFESAGYANLNSVMVCELNKVLFEVLLSLDCMEVKDISGTTYLYPIKKGW